MVTDSGGLQYQKPVSISLNDINEAPHLVEIDNEIREGKKKNSLVGQLLAKDEDFSDTHSYSLIDGEGSTHNQLFKIKTMN